MLLPAPMAALPSCWGRWQWKPRASEAPRRNGGLWTTLRCVDVGVKEDGRRGVDGAQRAEDIGVLPARLGRRCDVPVRRARRVQVHRPEGGDAESVVAARLQPRCGGRIGGAARVSGVAAVARVGANSGAPPPVAGWRRPGVCGSGRVPRAPQHLPIVSAGLVVLNSARSTMLVGSSCAMATTNVVPPPSQAAYTVGIGAAPVAPRRHFRRGGNRVTHTRYNLTHSSSPTPAHPLVFL